jgi:hypothetical protein
MKNTDFSKDPRVKKIKDFEGEVRVAIEEKIKEH